VNLPSRILTQLSVFGMAAGIGRFQESPPEADSLVLAGCRLRGVASPLVTTTVATVATMSYVTPVSSVVPTGMVATAAVGV